MSKPASVSSVREASALDPKHFPVRVQFLHLAKLSFEATEIPDNLSPKELAKASPRFLKVAVTANVGDTRATTTSTLSFVFGCRSDNAQAHEPTEKAAGEQEPERGYYSLEVRYVAGFLYDPKEIAKEDVQRWCEQGSFYVVMPYMRSLISQVTSESGFPVVLLPLLQVPAFKALHENKSTTDQKSVAPAGPRPQKAGPPASARSPSGWATKT